MEQKQEEMTDEKWGEFKGIARDYVCAECGLDLSIHTIPERESITVSCMNPEHHGWVQRETYTQAYRRGSDLHPAIKGNIEKRMMPKDDITRAMNILAARYPDVIKDAATAALFVVDCARLDLDPLLSPAEAIPVAFRGEKKTTISMIISSDGWLSMAARGCQEEWNGPPVIMRIEEYLSSLPQYKDTSYDDIQKITRDIKEAKCGDPDAWMSVAIGCSKTMTENKMEFGWLTRAEWKTAEDKRLPMQKVGPGNQADRRAIKRWVRTVYPECRQRMIGLTEEWRQRAEGIHEAERFIDAEYHLIEMPKVEEGRAARAKEEEGGKRRAARTPETKATVPPPPADVAPAPSAATHIIGKDFTIERSWLTQTLSSIHWSEETAKSWLVFNLKLEETSGSLEEVLSKLTTKQVEQFMKKLDSQSQEKLL